MSGGNILNIGDLGKPAQKLIECVSNAIGVLYERTRIRKKAEAKADSRTTSSVTLVRMPEFVRRLTRGLRSVDSCEATCRPTD